MYRRPGILLALFLMAMVLPPGLFFYGKKVKRQRIVHKTLLSPHWKERAAELNAVPGGSYKVIFLGNSLTELFDLGLYFGGEPYLNAGIVGDFTEGLLKRSDAIVRLKPKKLFIEIGINDLIEQVPVDEVIANYGELIERVQAQSPATRIYIQSNLPVIIHRPGLTSDEQVNRRILAQNARLRELALQKGVTYIDLYAAFRRSGYLQDLLVADGIHLTNKGYSVWKNALSEHLAEQV